MEGAITTGIPWLDWLLLAAAVLTALGAGYKVLSDRVFPTFRKVDNFLDDWNGQPARPGVKGRSGVMQRLDQLENNGGKSIKDQVEMATRIAKENQAMHAVTQASLDEHIEQSKTILAQGALWERDYQRDRDARNAEIASLSKTVADLASTMSVVAKSTPPEERP